MGTRGAFAPLVSMLKEALWLCTVRNWLGDLPDERPKQLTPPSFRRDVKQRIPLPDAACIVGLS